jgi:hypothetical protein
VVNPPPPKKKDKTFFGLETAKKNSRNNHALKMPKFQKQFVARSSVFVGNFQSFPNNTKILKPHFPAQLELIVSWSAAQRNFLAVVNNSNGLHFVPSFHPHSE